MPTDVNAIRQFWAQDTKRKEALGLFTKRDGVNYFTIKTDGDYEVRAIELGAFYTGSHWGILEGRDGRNGGTVKCPRVFDGSPCPVCEMVEQLANSDDPADRKQAEDWQVQVKYPILIVDLNEQSGEVVPRIYEAPKTVYGGFMKWLDPKYKYGNILDLQKGRNCTITRSQDKKKGFVVYDVIPDPTPSAFDIDPATLPKLEEALAPRSYEDIEYAIQNGEYPPRADEQEEKKPEPRRTAPALRKPAPVAAAEEAPPEDPPEDPPTEDGGEEAPEEQAAPPARRTLPRLPQRQPAAAPAAKPASAPAPAAAGKTVQERLAALKRLKK